MYRPTKTRPFLPNCVSSSMGVGLDHDNDSDDSDDDHDDHDDHDNDSDDDI